MNVLMSNVLLKSAGSSWHCCPLAGELWSCHLTGQSTANWPKHCKLAKTPYIGPEHCTLHWPRPNVQKITQDFRKTKFTPNTVSWPKHCELDWNTETGPNTVNWHKHCNRANNTVNLSKHSTLAQNSVNWLKTL